MVDDMPPCREASYTAQLGPASLCHCVSFIQASSRSDACCRIWPLAWFSATNVFFVPLYARAPRCLLLCSSGGSIVFIGRSVSQRGSPGQALYAASKAALAGAARTLAVMMVMIMITAAAATSA